MAKKKNSMIGNMLNASIATIVGTGMVGAAANQAAAIPAGMAHDMAGTAVGLGGVALMGPNLKLVNQSFGGMSGSSKRRKKTRKLSYK